MNNRDLLQSLKELFKDWNPGAAGALIGFAFALSWVIFGFFKTLFILALTAMGYFIGVRYFSHKEDFRELLNKILPPGLFR